MPSSLASPAGLCDVADLDEAAAVQRASQSRDGDVLLALARTEHLMAQPPLAQNPASTAGVLDALIERSWPDSRLRRLIAQHPALTAAQQARLADDLAAVDDGAGPTGSTPGADNVFTALASRGDLDEVVEASLPGRSRFADEILAQVSVRQTTLLALAASSMDSVRRLVCENVHASAPVLRAVWQHTTVPCVALTARLLAQVPTTPDDLVVELPAHVVAAAAPHRLVPAGMPDDVRDLAVRFVPTVGCGTFTVAALRLLCEDVLTHPA
jgi:hypothetical protein